MSILLASFFISLFGISAMIGRRLFLLKNKRLVNLSSFTHDFAIEVPDLEDVKDLAHKNLKRFSYATLVHTLRVYLISMNLLKKKYKLLKDKIRKMRRNGNTNDVVMMREENKFLKMMSEYKTKIKKIKTKIKEEEGLN